MNSDLTSHVAIEGTSTIAITREDTRREGHANGMYRISGFDTEDNPSAVNVMGYRSSFSSMPLVFQTGIHANGAANGITIESLLAVCEDRLKQFQEGPYASRHNEYALKHIELAMMHLHERTKERN